MTKKELKQIENAKAEKVNLRYRLVDAYTNYYGDLEAYERVNRINGEEMTDEIRQKVFDRYPMLKEYGYSIKAANDIENGIKKAIHQIIATEKKYRGWKCDERFEKGVGRNDLVLDESFIDMEFLVALVKYANMFGYERLVYTRNDLETLSDLIDIGCKVVDTNRRDGDGGLVLDITDTKMEFFLLLKAEKERNKLIKHNAEWGRETKQEDIDAIDTKYKNLIDFIKK